jgi:hypothetical protein
MNKKKPITFNQIEDIWYEGYKELEINITTKADTIF